MVEDAGLVIAGLVGVALILTAPERAPTGAVVAPQ
jgi:hypothetical protein